MADSVRRKIIAASITALESSTTIAYVTTKKEEWWNWDVSKYPGVMVIASELDKRQRFAYPNAGEDMYSSMELNCIGYMFDINNDLSVKRTDLIRNIERVLTNNISLMALVNDFVPVTVETDQGTLDNYGIVHCKYIAKYTYNHGTP
jgi:hypothetical protein